MRLRPPTHERHPLVTLNVYADLEQGSEEWLAARCGLITASTIGKLITPTLKVADNETSRGITYTLAAERITGVVDHVHPTWDMQRGTDDEPFARIAYAEHHAPVHEVGFMVRELSDGVRLGYSPDGLVGDDGLIEIKSRKPKEQVRTILSDRVPSFNVAQLQAGLLVSGREWVDYVSYRDGMPLFVRRVYPDRAWFTAIEEAARTFETNVNTIVTNYTKASTRYAATERRPELEDIRI